MQPPLQVNKPRYIPIYSAAWPALLLCINHNILRLIRHTTVHTEPKEEEKKKKTSNTMPVYLETSKSSYVFDHAKPDNPNIPFFPTPKEYKQNLLQDLPADSQPDRDHVWLVEPGINSIEVYEAIIVRALGSCLPLKIYLQEWSSADWTPTTSIRPDNPDKGCTFTRRA